MRTTRLFRLGLAAAVLAAVTVPAAGSADGRCKLYFHDGDPIPSVVC